MPRWRPTDAELAAIIAEVEKQAGEDTSLADNLLFHRLYHHEKGLYLDVVRRRCGASRTASGFATSAT